MTRCWATPSAFSLLRVRSCWWTDRSSSLPVTPSAILGSGRRGDLGASRVPLRRSLLSKVPAARSAPPRGPPRSSRRGPPSRRGPASRRGPPSYRGAPSRRGPPSRPRSPGCPPPRRSSRGRSSRAGHRAAARRDAGHPCRRSARARRAHRRNRPGHRSRVCRARGRRNRHVPRLRGSRRHDLLSLARPRVRGGLACHRTRGSPRCAVIGLQSTDADGLAQPAPARAVGAGFAHSGRCSASASRSADAMKGKWKRGPCVCRAPFRKVCPAASYSPTPSPVQYHRR